MAFVPGPTASRASGGTGVFCPGWSHQPGPMAKILSRLKQQPGTKGDDRPLLLIVSKSVAPLCHSFLYFSSLYLIPLSVLLARAAGRGPPPTAQRTAGRGLPPTAQRTSHRRPRRRASHRWQLRSGLPRSARAAGRGPTAQRTAGRELPPAAEAREPPLAAAELAAMECTSSWPPPAMQRARHRRGGGHRPPRSARTP